MNGKSVKTVLTIGVLVLMGTLMVAQESSDSKKSSSASKSGILHPEMKVENGSYAKPMAKLGQKPDQAWSATTTAAGVNGKPQMGR